MCDSHDEDFVYGSGEYTVSANANSWTQLLGPNPARTGLVISNNGSVGVTISTQVGAGTSQGGIFLAQNSPPLVLNWEYFNGLIQKPFFVLAASSTATVGAWESEELDV